MQLLLVLLALLLAPKWLLRHFPPGTRETAITDIAGRKILLISEDTAITDIAVRKILLISEDTAITDIFLALRSY